MYLHIIFFTRRYFLKILINASNLKFGGGKQVFLSFIRELEKNNFYGVNSTSFMILINDNLEPYFQECFFCVKNDNVRVIKLSKKRIYNLVNIRKTLTKIEQEFSPDIVFTVFGPAYWKPENAKHLVGFALPWMINPDSPVFLKDNLYKRIAKKIYNKIRGFILKYEAGHFLVETENVKNRLSNYYSIDKDNINVVSNAISENFINFDVNYSHKFLELENVKEKKVLMLSAFYEHKNFEIIRAAANDDRFSEYKFILTIDNGKFESFFNNQSNIINLGPLDPYLCPALYHCIDIVIQPSLLECFSANYIESLYMKVPIVASDFDFSREILREYASYFKYNDLSSLYDALSLVVSIAPSEAQSYVLSTYPTASERAKSYLNIMQRIL